ncbi:MAG: PAS domain S-box protein [Candidatus Manganitrophus sp.]|nr:PAS domain S-box protein [Candidatus Manganitrophus sp.]
MSKELEQRVLEQTRELAAANEALRKETIERRRAEEALRLSEEQFRGAFDHAPIGMALLHPDGRWLRVNPVFCRMLGYSEQELIGANFQSTPHPDDLQPPLEGFQRLLSGELDLFTMEKRFFHKEGRTIWTNVSATVVRRAGEKPPYFVKQIQDITEPKRAEIGLARIRESLPNVVRNSITEGF